MSYLHTMSGIRMLLILAFYILKNTLPIINIAYGWIFVGIMFELVCESYMNLLS